MGIQSLGKGWTFSRGKVFSCSRKGRGSMLKRVIVGCVLAFACALFAQSANAATSFAFTGPVDRSGDVSGPLQIADDFTVNSPTGITVSQLGLFIDGYDGSLVTAPSESHVVRLLNRSNGTQIASVTVSGNNINNFDGPFSYGHPLNSLSTSPQFNGGWGYVNISPVVLPSGFQGSIVAYTMSDSGAFIDDYGEAVGFNDGGGLISFTHSFYAATTSTSGDPTLHSSLEHLGAGSFTFAAVAATPEPAALSLLTLAAALTLRRGRRTAAGS